MPNTLLNSSVITRESLRVLHNELNLIGNTNRDFTDQFAKSGAKIGQTLNIRKPNQFTVRRGRVAQTQNVYEETLPITVGQLTGVDLEFDSRELTLDLDRFSERYIQPSVKRLASAIEADVWAYALPRIPNAVVSAGALTLRQALNAGAILTNHLAPGSDRFALVNTTQEVDVVDGTSTLFNSQAEIGKQYRNGRMGRAAGFDWYTSTTVPRFFGGAAAGYLVNGANQIAADQNKPGETQTLIVDTGTGAIAAGTVFTLANVFEVNPETKAQTGKLRQFTVLDSNATPATSITISPPIITTGAKQNVSAAPADNAPLVIATTASQNYDQGVFMHRDALTFGTIDLDMPRGMDMAARESLDGVSMRFLRGFDITNDAWISRLDVLPVYGMLYPDFAVKALSTPQA